MNTKALWSVTILGTVAALFSACGDGDSTKIKICNAKQQTCLNDQGGQVCSADGTANLPFQCGQGQHCCDPSVKGASCGEDVKKPTCVGDCDPGATECGSKGVALRCADDGRQWVATACPVGTGCDSDAKSNTYGTCVNSDDPDNVVVVCTGNDKLCADGKTAKVCEPDGTNWVYTACAENENCDEGACVLDPDKGCVPHSGTCQDKTHVKMCNDDGDAYDKVEECPDGTTCEDGACQGPVCPVGAIRCDDVRVGSGFLNALTGGTYQPQALYSCNKDGTAWEISSCGASEICIYDNISSNTVNTYVEALIAAVRTDSLGVAIPVLSVPSSSRGACATPECASPFALRKLYGVNADRTTAGSFTCGDGRNPGDDALGSFSLCEGLPPFNNLYWANYACTAPETCVYEQSPADVEEDAVFVGPKCSADCVPGTTACINPSNGSVGDVGTFGESTVTCNDEGKWDYGTTEKCVSKDSNPRELWCGPNLQGTSDNFNIGTCMEPACAHWFSAYDTFTLPEGIGACGADGKFYPCNPDGSFGKAQDCSECTEDTSNTPLSSSSPDTFAGYEPGTCVTCTDEAQRCVFTTGSTPYRQVCDKGIWSTTSCNGGKLCWDYQDPDTGLQSVLCGAECAPFTAMCGGEGGQQIASCDKDGNLSVFKNCPTGACHTDQVSEQSELGAAYCEAECITGTAECTSVPDPDNAEALAPASIACTNKGRYDTQNPKICDWTNLQNPETCYDKVGCAECDSGTFSGRPQVRCALDENGVTADPAAVQICKNGHWDNAINCPGGGTVTCFGGYCASTDPNPSEGGSGGQGNAASGTGGAPQ